MIRGVVAAVAVTLTVVGASAGPAPAQPAGTGAAAFPPGRPTRVLVLGDSVMKGAEAQFAAALPGREVVVDAEVNRTTGQGADIVAQVGTDWDVVVVMLGHNDGGSPGVFQPAARRVLDQLRDVPRVGWLTIHEVRDYYPAVNQFVAGLGSEYPNLRIGDWNAVAAANPGAVAGDGLHLTAAGAGLMADLTAEMVQVAELEFLAAMAALAPPTTTTTTSPPTTTTTTPPTTTTTAPATTTSTSTPRQAVTTTTDEVQAMPVSTGPGSAGISPLAGTAIVALGLGGLALGVRRRRGAQPPSG